MEGGDEIGGTGTAKLEDAEKEGMFWKVPLPPESMHFVDSQDSDSFSSLVLALERATVIAMDAEWKPVRHGSGSAGVHHPRVSILQIACRLQSSKEAGDSQSPSGTRKIAPEPKLKTGNRGNAPGDGDMKSERGIHRGIGLDGHKLTGEGEEGTKTSYDMIFLLDLLALPASAFSKMLKNVFVDPAVLKLGFGFKQDLLHLQESFPGPDSHGCFDKMEPYLDVRKLFRHLHANKLSCMSRGRRVMIGGENSLSTVSEKILGLPLSKEMQCSNWDQRPLSRSQFDYAAADAYCLLKIFDVLQLEASESWFSPIVAGDDDEDVLWDRSLEGISEIQLGVAALLSPQNGVSVGVSSKYAHDGICQPKRGDAKTMVKAALGEFRCSGLRGGFSDLPSKASGPGNKTLDVATLVHRFGERLLVSEGRGVVSNRKTRKTRSRRAKDREAGKNGGLQSEEDLEYEGPPPWDTSVGGDGIPKFLCDAMVEGLARQLRCVGIDAASPNSRKCEPRELVDLAEKEGRIILTRDVKLLRRKVVPAELAYRVKRQGKWDQLAEIIDAFQLVISKHQLLSRCTKCNGSFIRQALTAEQAAVQGPWNQVIPECVLKDVDEFWQCSNCKHLYWQGSVFTRAFEQFVSVCQAGKAEQD